MALMRNVFALFLAVSLSWITTSYACQMDMAEAVQANCCCLPGDQQHSTADTATAVADCIESDGCCDVVVSSSVGDQALSLGFSPPALDLPDQVAPPQQPRLFAPSSIHAAFVQRDHASIAGAGTRTYLLTSRLRL